MFSVVNEGAEVTLGGRQFHLLNSYFLTYLLMPPSHAMNTK